MTTVSDCGDRYQYGKVPVAQLFCTASITSGLLEKINSPL